MITRGLGYLGSAVLYAAAIAVPAVAHRWGGLNAVAAFWAAYVLTRPLGASVADWMAVAGGRGGLDLGTAGSSAVLPAVLLGLTAYAHARERRDHASSPALPPETGGHDRVTERSG